MFTKNDVTDYFDKQAGQWDKTLSVNDEIISRIFSNAKISAGQEILDVGCGTGVLFPYYTAYKVRSITGADISREMIQIASEKFPETELINCDAEVYCFNKMFDSIMIYNAFPHFPNPEQLIRNMHLHTKPEGRISVAHGMSKKQLDIHHKKMAGSISNMLLNADDLAEIMSAYYYIDTVISDNTMYQVCGTKKQYGK